MRLEVGPHGWGWGTPGGDDKYMYIYNTLDTCTLSRQSHWTHSLDKYSGQTLSRQDQQIQTYNVNKQAHKSRHVYSRQILSAGKSTVYTEVVTVQTSKSYTEQEE